MTWLDEVNAHVGREPAFAFPEPIRGDRRGWAWSVNGENRNIVIDKLPVEYRVRAGAPGRHAEIFTIDEPTEADIRSALRFVGLLPDRDLIEEDRNATA